VNQSSDVDWEASYRHCAEVTRRATSNFSWAFATLRPEKRRAMLALYAFARVSDDIADSDLPIAERRAKLSQLHSALQDPGSAGHLHSIYPFLPALFDTVARYDIPVAYPLDILAGVVMDLDHTRYVTFAELETYCYRVASAVGLACIHIWGFDRQDGVESLVHRCGMAFQITNILRDLKEDVLNDRIYLPQEELVRFGYQESDLRDEIVDGRFRELMEFQIARARTWFEDSAALQDYLHPDGQRIFPLLHDTYRRLLDAIARRNGDVFRRRVRLGMTERFQIAWGQWRRRRAVGKSRPVAYSS
jgi:15-cis-phytoene synthase